MATNATLFGNGGSSQSAASKTLSFTTPFHTDQVTAAVTDNNFWSSVKCDPVPIKTASASPASAGTNKKIIFNFGSSIAINKLLSIDVVMYNMQGHSYLYARSIIGMCLYAPDDGYIASGVTGLNVFYLPYNNNGYHTLASVSGDNYYTLTYTTGDSRIEIATSGNPYYTFERSKSALRTTIRYI